MKLFAVACLASTGSAQSGDYEDRGVSSDYYTAYTDYDDYGNKKNKNYESNWFGDGKYDLGGQTTVENDWAVALNCWPSNIDADSLVFNNQNPESGSIDSSYVPSKDAKTATTYPNQAFHARAPQHVYGSWEVSDRAAGAPADSREGSNTNTGGQLVLDPKEVNLHQEDPVYRSGLGGLYQYGHDTFNSGSHNENMEGTAGNGATRWTHYKQARHAGCLYEKSNWHYGYDTFDTIFLANYYQGYGDFNRAAAGKWLSAFEAEDDPNGASAVQPIWWHFFNAHVLPNPNHGNTCSGTRCSFPTYPEAQVRPDSAAFVQPQVQNSIPLVIANPAYEGLGFLNFVVEYKNKNKYVGGDYTEFVDSTPGLYSDERYNADAGTTCSAGSESQCAFSEMDTYKTINASNNQESAGWGQSLNNWNGVHGMYYYDLYAGSWLITKAMNTAQNRARKWTLYPMRDVSGDDVNMAEWGRDNSDAPVVNWSMNLYDSDHVNAGSTPYSLDGGSIEWYSTNQNPGSRLWSEKHDLAVSSFPHNNLGKDFRFNLRVLQGTVMQRPTGNAYGSSARANFEALSNCGVAVAADGTFGTGTTACSIETGYKPSSVEFDTLVNDYNDSFFFSYYFYKINEIEIKFPHHVAYALYHENRDSGTTTTDGRIDITDTDGEWWNTMNNNQDRNEGGHDGTDADAFAKNIEGGDFNNPNTANTVGEANDFNFMHRSASATNKNIIPPVDLGTHAASQGEFHRVYGYLSVNGEAAIKNAADWCDADQRDHGEVELERVCGYNFNIVGLMNTYDERRGQRGTYQEVWVHLQYAMGKGGRDATGNDATDAAAICSTGDVSADARCDEIGDHPMQSPWPYNHFMASEILEIKASCSTLNVNNPNTCRDINFGPGRTSNAAYGGK
jgi:hypothetical protein